MTNKRRITIPKEPNVAGKSIYHNYSQVNAVKIYQIYKQYNDPWDSYCEIIGSYTSRAEAEKHVLHKGYREKVDFHLNDSLSKVSREYQGVYVDRDEEYFMYIKPTKVFDKFDCGKAG